MADIELVIKIPEELTKKGRWYTDEEMWVVIKATQNGTPLPKGHGRLIDADDVDNHIIGHVDTRSCPTIIEADKESEGQYADSN